MSVLWYNFAIETATEQLFELPGNKKPSRASVHSAGTSYFGLVRGRLEVFGYELLKGKDGMNCDSEEFPEVMISVRLRSLFNTFLSIFPGVLRFSMGNIFFGVPS